MSNKLDRKEAYAIIKEAGLQNVIKKQFGRNYTQVSNEDLYKVINEYVDIVDERSVEEIYDDVKTLAEGGFLSPDELEGLAELLAELAARMRIYS